ncbi:hypothetical protein V8C43DRAFT_305513 [Trichoderma afarasin]
MSTDSIHKPTSNAAQAETDNPPMALHGAPDRNVENKVIANYAWGRTLVITGYKQQKRLLKQKIAELPEAEVPRGLVSVRTIDDSPSHQAEFVICESGVLMQKVT